MSKNFVPKYKYFTNGKNIVVAVCQWGGRPVRAVAKCSPEDTFDLEKGKEIAKARLDLKVAGLRVKNAKNRLEVAKTRFHQAGEVAISYQHYYNDALEERSLAEEAYARIVN